MLSLPTPPVGDESPLIEVAFQALAQADNTFSPFVIVGPNAAGLSEWISLAISERTRDSKSLDVLVVSGKDFARSVGLATTTDTLIDFRERIDRADVLILEMVEPVADDSATCRELSSLLDRAMSQVVGEKTQVPEAEGIPTPARCVVLTTLRLPNQTAGWPSSLSSRLLQGLSVSIGTPPRRLREARLKRRLQPWIAEIPAEVLEQWLVTPCATLAEWDQRLDQIVASLSEESFDIDSLGATSFEASNVPAEIDPKQLLRVVAKLSELRVADLKGTSRRRSMVLARSVAIYLLRHLTSLSLEAIGKLLGNRDHTTVLHAVRKITEGRATDFDTERLIDRVCRELNVDPPASEHRGSTS
ncbi:MAG: hypothetical protein KDA83_14165 [Planctomycetales bacterium]|nr:hypothetical protein [Planctomycetales bacterium]